MVTSTGTCAASLLSAAGKSTEARRVAIAYLLFKVSGVVLLLPVLNLVEAVVVAMSPSIDPTLAVEPNPLDVQFVVSTQIANTHTLFNVIVGIVFLPMLGLVANFMTWLVPPTAPAVVSRASPHPTLIDEADYKVSTRVIIPKCQ